jgi:hypothetical protein
MAAPDLLNGTPTAPGATEFDEWLRKRNGATALRASTVLGSARLTVSPEDAARRSAVSMLAGSVLGQTVPARLLAEPGILSMVENKVKSTQAYETLQKHPLLAEWFSDQDNAAIASDRVAELGVLSEVFNGVARGADKLYDDAVGPGAGLRLTSSALANARDSSRTFAEIRAEEKGKPFRDQSMLPDVKALGRWLNGRIYGLTAFGDTDENISTLEAATAENIRDIQREETERQAAFPVGRGSAEISRMIDALPDDAGFLESTKHLLGIMNERPGDFIGFLAGTASESGISLVAAAAVAAATKSPAAARATLFGTTVPIVRASNTLELAGEMGYDLSKPEDAKRLAANQSDLDQLISRVGTYATVVSLVDATTAGLGSAMVKNPVGSFALEAVAQAVAGGSGEILGRMMSGQKWNWTEAILEGLAEMLTAPMEAAGVGSQTVFRKYREVQSASDRRAFFKELSTGAAQSELRKRSPEAYRSAVEKLTADGPVENVYVDAGRMEQLFQDAPEQLQQLFDTVPDLDYRAFQQAAETGGVFAIPTAIYATNIAGTDIDARLTDLLRLRPDRLSYAEAQEAMAEVEQQMQGLEQRVRELEETSELDPSAQAEYADLTTQLIAAGRAPGMARAEAQLLATTAQTMAQRQGLTTAEYIRQNILPTVRSETAPRGQSPFRVMRLDDLGAALSDPSRAGLPEYEAIIDELAESNLTPETATEDDIRLAAIAVADKGGLVSNLNEEFLLTPSGIYRAVPGEQMMQTVSLRNGEEDLSQWGHTPGKKIGTRALALIMEKRQRALYGKIGRTNFGPKTIEKMANWMADEIEFELQTPGATAEGWYTTKFQAALDVMAERFPELRRPDPTELDPPFTKLNLPGLRKVNSAYEARQLMTMIIAVTSNGAKVVDNYAMAARAYAQFRATGRFEAVRGGERASSITSHLHRIGQVLADHATVTEAADFLNEGMTVSELNKELKSIGMPVLSKMPSTAIVPRAAVIFGPKLGAFYANLSGADGYLTMDLWWTRTINRYRGDVLPKVSGLKNAVDSKGKPVGLHRFKWLVGQPDLTDSQALRLVVDHAQRYADRGYKGGDEAEKAANTLYKAAFVKLQESPLSAKERAFMIEVAGAARDELAKRTGKRYSIADVQALIWYYEKRLMAEMGAKESGDISYEDAARRAVGGPGGDVFSQGADGGRAEGDDPAAGGTAAGDAGAVPDRLPDLEAASPGPVAGVRAVASSYMRRMGLPVRHQASYVKVDKTRAAEIARLYDEMPDAPNDPEVQRAYKALAQETIAQYDALRELGFTFEWITGDDPYASPAEAIKDMQENKHLWVFPTDSGFGTLNEASASNPLLAMSGRLIDGREARINDLFRVVHDVFGHGSEGASFGARGEENAWQAHVRMFSPLAARAMTTETRGQNSWVNYGPYGEANRKDPKNTVFADQKVGLLPGWVSEVGQAEDKSGDGTFFQSAATPFKEWFGDSVVTKENGDPMKVMHATRFEEAIDEFLPLTHFGTAKAANDRVSPTQAADSAWGATTNDQRTRIYPVYLAMENPLAIGREQGFSDSDGWADDGDMVRQFAAVLNQQARDTDDAAKARAASKLQTLFELSEAEKIEPEEVRREAATILEELGYDGVTYTNIIEDPGSTSYIVLRPQQVKSAFNRGTFDRNDPRILYQGAETAIPADFDGELQLNTFRKRGWFIVSATQSHFGDWDSAENVAEAERMRQWLKDTGLGHREVRGRYAGTDDGPSFLVFGDETTYGQTARSMFRQESILTRQGFVYSPYEGRKPVPFIGLKTGADVDPDADYQTTLPNGETFALAMDWPDPKSDDPRDDLSIREDGMVELVHWSPRERTTIDPKHAGKGKLDGPERHRSGPNKAFYGLNHGKRNTAYQRESSSLGGLKHTVAVDPAKLYPWDTDPDGLREQISGSLPAPQQIGAYEQAIKQAGYAGYFVIDGPLGDVAAIFEALPVEKVERDMTLYQSDEAFFKSALSQAILEAKQETAPAQDWLKIIPKLPGVKKAELEWTGLTEWLEGQEPTRKLSRHQLYHWLSSAQVQIEVVEGPGTFDGYKTDLGGTPAYYEEILITVPNLDQIGPNAGKEIGSAIANSGHFDTPNIVVHARVQRTSNVAGDLDTLFVDEIQSDLNSFWRKRGGQKVDTALTPDEKAQVAELERLVAEEEAASAAYGEAWDQFREHARATTAQLFEGDPTPIEAARWDDALGYSSRGVASLVGAIKLAREEGHFETFDAFLGQYLVAAARGRLGDAIAGSGNSHLESAMGRMAATAMREAAAPGWEAALERVNDATERRRETRNAASSYRRNLPDALFERLNNVQALPFTPFEGESAVQLAMKYLTTYAARKGFKKIAWTPGYMQMKRWGVQEQRAQGMVEAYMAMGQSDGHRVVALRLEGQRSASFTVDANGQVTDTGLGFPPELIRNRNIREILPQGLAERVMRAFPEGETMMSEEASDFPEVNISDNAGQGYRIVYDQQMKRFLEKWGGKFGARVESDVSIAGSAGGMVPGARLAYQQAWRDREGAGEITAERARRFMNASEDYGNISEGAAKEMRIAYESGDYGGVIDIGFRRMGNGAIQDVARQIGDAEFFPVTGQPVWALEFSDEFRAEATKPQPLFQDRPSGARGQIILPPAGSDAAPEITVFDRADLSTVIHEGGHWMLWLLQTGAQKGDQFSGEMLETVTAWFASQADDIANEVGLIAPQVLEYLANGTTGSVDVDAAVHRGLHERFARGFEAYMREGKAPSIALKGVFHRFAAWLMEVYKSAKQLRVELSDEVRQVFDKMIATDAQIAQARQLSVGAAEIAATAKAMGLDEASYAELVRLQDEERAEAFGIAMRETLAPIMAQRSKEMRQLRAELTKKISDEVNGQKHNRAFEWLANGRWLGAADRPDDLPADLRMDPQSIVDDYDQETLDKLPRGRRAMTRVDGLTADETAGWFGYDTGAELINDLTNKPRARDEIKQKVQAALEEHIAAQDPRDEVEATAAVVDALHGEKHGQVLAAELRAINRVSNRKKTITSRQQAAQIARDVIARSTVRDAIRSDLYAKQARTYAEQASRALAVGDTDAAFEAKRRQLIQHSLFVESRKAADLVARAERKAARLKRAGTRKNLAGEYLEAIDDLLYTYDFRKMSAAAEKKRGGLLRYIEMMSKAGRENELAIPDHLITNAQRTPYKTMTVQRLQGVLDALTNIEHTARLKKKLLDKQRERDMDAVVADIEQAFDANIKNVDMNRVPTGFEKVRDAVREYVNYAANADTLLRRLDGWKLGDVYRHLKAGIDRASASEVVMRLRASAELDRLFAPYAKSERRKMAVRRVWGGSDQSLSKWDLISIALNSGNKDNFERLTSRDNPKAFSKAQVQELLTHLDERDWAFVQSVWDHLDKEYWPQIAAREKRTTGVVPKKVEAQLMVSGLPKMPTGLSGGYYPIVYDRRFSAKVAEEKHQEIQNAMQAGRFGKAQTKNGHTKERAAGSGGRTIELGVHVLFGHVNQVIHDLALSEEVANGWKILQEPRVRGLFERAGLLQDLSSLEIWLQDVAAGQIVGGGVLGRMARHAKSGFTVSKLAFNMSTVAIQITGLAQTAAYLGKRQTALGYSSYVAQGIFPAAARVKARSEFMAERERTFQRDMFDLVGEVNNTPVGGRAADFRALLMSAGFWAMQKVQFYAVDAPTWIAGYEAGRKQGLSDDEAVANADRVVARAQASGVYADRTAVERGSLGRETRQNEFLRLFTALGSYMFAKFNVAQEIAGRTKRDIADPDKNTIAAVLNGTIDMLLIFTVEAVLYHMIRGTLPGDDDDEDEQGWLAFLATETALSAMGTLPFIRDMGSVLQGFSGGGAYGGVLETLGKPFLQIGQGEMDKQLFRSLNDLLGVAAPGYPSTAMWRLVDAEMTRRGGDEVSPLAYIMGVPR